MEASLRRNVGGKANLAFQQIVPLPVVTSGEELRKRENFIRRRFRRGGEYFG